MKLLKLSLIALASLTIASFAQTASPIPTPTQEERIAKLEALLAEAKAPATPSLTSMPTPLPIFNITVAPVIQQQTAQAPPAPPAAAPVVVVEPAPVASGIPVHQQYPALMEWIIGVNDAINRHDGQWLTRFTSGNIVYFGHDNVSDGYILRDTANDDRTYFAGHSTYYPDTFTHEISSEYSSRWVGPMIYDSMTIYTEVQERYGRLHRANVRLTVGYTVINGATTIYALVMKVLPGNS